MQRSTSEEVLDHKVVARIHRMDRCVEDISVVRIRDAGKEEDSIQEVGLSVVVESVLASWEVESNSLCLAWH